VQLRWKDVDVDAFGAIEQVVFDAGSVMPRRLDPQVNLVPLLGALGGQVLSLNWPTWGRVRDQEQVLFDGDLDTVLRSEQLVYGWNSAWNRKECRWWGPRLWYLFDFGRPQHVEQLRFFAREPFRYVLPVERFLVGVDDGDDSRDGFRDYEVGRRGGEYFDFAVIHQMGDNHRGLVEIELPDTPIRRLLLEVSPNATGFWEIAEIEVYGSGFVRSATYTSNIIDLGSAVSLGEMVWAGRSEGKAKVQLPCGAARTKIPTSTGGAPFAVTRRRRATGRDGC
jgi:hypothetical protein